MKINEFHTLLETEGKAESIDYIKLEWLVCRNVIHVTCREKDTNKQRAITYVSQTKNPWTKRNLKNIQAGIHKVFNLGD